MPKSRKLQGARAVNSTLDLQIVLDTIVAKAVQLSGTDSRNENLCEI